MSLDAEEQEFLDFALGSLPRWMRDDDYHLRGAAKLFGSVRAQGVYWAEQTLIGHATGPTSDQPDWLNQHAIDRGTRRQSTESDVALRARIRNVPDALTRASLLAAADLILASEGIVGSSAMVELPRDGAFTATYVSNTGTGGTFTTSGSSKVFTPTVPFARVPYRDPSVIRLIQSFRLDISGAANPGNNGNRAITGMLDNGAKVTNGGGVNAVDPTVTWTIRKVDRRGNVRDGFNTSYASRGYRASPIRPLIVIILPYGSTASTEASVREMLRQKKAAGFAALVERRVNP